MGFDFDCNLFYEDKFSVQIKRNKYLDKKLMCLSDPYSSFTKRIKEKKFSFVKIKDINDSEMSDEMLDIIAGKMFRAYVLLING